MGELRISDHNDDMILQWGRKESKIIDLQGKMVIPGMIDSHLHLSWGCV